MKSNSGCRTKGHTIGEGQEQGGGTHESSLGYNLERWKPTS